MAARPLARSSSQTSGRSSVASAASRPAPPPAAGGARGRVEVEVNPATAAGRDGEPAGLHRDRWREHERAAPDPQPDVAARRRPCREQVRAHPDAAALERVTRPLEQPQHLADVDHVAKPEPALAQMEQKRRLGVAVEVHRNEADDSEEVVPEKAAIAGPERTDRFSHRGPACPVGNREGGTRRGNRRLAPKHAELRGTVDIVGVGLVVCERAFDGKAPRDDALEIVGRGRALEQRGQPHMGRAIRGRAHLEPSSNLGRTRRGPPASISPPAVMARP